MKKITQTQAALCGLSLLIVFIVTLALTPANAATFSVSPIKIDMSAEASIASIKIKNPNDHDVSIHAEIYEWTQESSQPKLEPTKNLLITPPIFTIPAESLQIMRVGLRSTPDRHKEVSYRLHLTEIPSPNTEHTHDLSVATRLSLPVFVAPIVPEVNFDLKWKLDVGPDKNAILSVHNQGNGHAKISELKLNKIGGNAVSNSVVAYILPTSKQEWFIPSERHAFTKADDVELTAKVNNEWVRALIHVQ